MSKSKPQTIATLWIALAIIFSVISLYTALNPLALPNISLICYGFAVICVWQALGSIYSYCLKLLTEPNTSHPLIGGFGILAVLFFIYSGLVSLISTLLMFPNPIIHTCLAIVVYATSMVIAIIVGYYCYLLIKGPSELALSHIERRKVQEQTLQQWQAQAPQIEPHEITDYLANAKQDNSFAINFWIFATKKILSLLLWMTIPFWIFTIIPLRTYSSIDQAPLFYILATIATVLFLVIRLATIINSASCSFSLTERGIRHNSLLRTQSFLWNHVCKVTVEQGVLYVTNIHGKTMFLQLNEINACEKLYRVFTNTIPLALFEINEYGWRYLEKLLQGDFSEFVKKHKAACAGMPLSPQKKKKKKKKKKNSFKKFH